MDANSNIAAWMISGGLKASDATRDRNDAHLRALKASQVPSTGLIGRISAAIAAIRPSATPADVACCAA